MNLARSVLLWLSENEWMRTNVRNYSFLKRAVKRFMPGENLESAVHEALSLKEVGILTVFTQLGENISDLTGAKNVTDHYLAVLDSIAENNLPSEIAGVANVSSFNEFVAKISKSAPALTT